MKMWLFVLKKWNSPENHHNVFGLENFKIIVIKYKKKQSYFIGQKDYRYLIQYFFNK